MLKAQGLEIRVGEQRLLAGVDLTLEVGELLAVLGPNGAGKSTLLSVLAGDLEPSSGTVTLDCVPLRQVPDRQQAERRAVVRQAPTVAFDFRAIDVIEMGWLPEVVPGTYYEQAIAEVLEETETVNLADRVFSSLSGGEQQRVVYARALLQLWRPSTGYAPRWLLLDEPTANLDIKHAIALLESVRAQTWRGVGVAIVLHDLSLAARYADRVLLLDRGRPAGLGAPEVVMTSATLSNIYETPVLVERHGELDRLVVLS
ncbi:MAG: heme ABC transporter ATP-binding protein [Pseudomonadota bacterium]